ncbi:MAG: peptide chain release factor N(5)-glutamine methyltransferase [Cyanobacteriota bacterium]
MAVPALQAEALLTWRRALLQATGGEAADLDWLLDLEGGLRWRDLQALRLHPRRPVRLDCSLDHLEALWRRYRHEGLPLQYLIGRCPWRDLELSVGPGVLIPRQETESLVDLAVSLWPASSAPTHWADLGTGSGCLAVALAGLWPAARGLAVDISDEALRLATANVLQAGVGHGVTLLQGAWWEPLRPWWGQLDLVVANPPYIPSDVVEQLDPVVHAHEPRLALDGGVDGLDCLRAVLVGAAAALAPGGWLLVEHHHDQSAAVMRLYRAAGLVAVRAHPDLEGRARFVVGRRPEAVHSADGTP